MKKVIRLLEKEAAEIKVDIFQDEIFYKGFYDGKIPNSKKQRLYRKGKYLECLNKAIKILNEVKQ